MPEGGTVPGLLTIIDPSTNAPATTFTTDENGELTFEVVPTPGQEEVAVTIGDETYVVDLDEDGSGTITIPPEVVIDHANFNSVSANFQSTATLTPDFVAAYNITPTLPITWSVIAIINPGGFWKRGTTDYNGLTWGPTADGTSGWYSSTQPEGAAPTGAVAQLTDVVGNRTATVRAETTVDGTVYTKNLTVAFGDGPLSVFSGVDHPSKQFADSANYLSFPTAATVFPAAVTCGGFQDASTIVVTFGVGAAYGSGWTTYTHPTLAYPFAHADNSKLPTWEQLLAVATYNSSIMSDYPRKGAAKAAGWTTGLTWYGTVSYDNAFNFNFWTINTASGAFTPRSSSDNELVYCTN
jgi:hypothetical protein